MLNLLSAWYFWLILYLLIGLIPLILSLVEARTLLRDQFNAARWIFVLTVWGCWVFWPFVFKSAIKSNLQNWFKR